MKYKIGDKVKVREDLIAGVWYGEEAFVKEMEKWRGKTLTIATVLPDSKSYRVKEAPCCWWTDEMFDRSSIKNKFSNEVIFK